jgi:hypothetical protein
LAGECLGLVHGLAGGLADVGVVQEPVDGRGREGLGHELVERGWVQVRGDRHGPLLIRGVDEPVETLGRVLGDEAAAAIFQVVSQRYLKTSIVLTSNRGVGAWGEILGDTTVAAAMFDRLLHRSVVLNLDGDSYRLRAHHAANDTLRRTTTGTRQPLT